MSRSRPWLRRVARWAVGGALFVAVAVGLLLASFRWQADHREVVVATDAAPRSGRFVKADDVSLFVQEIGDPSRPAVVFVHGTGAWSETWLPAMKAAAEAGFRAIALDLPPFGYSERPNPPRYGKQDQGRRIAALLAAVAPDGAILVGHSFGGGPTVEAVLLAPERVRALVLVDVALGIRREGEPATAGPTLVRGLLAAAPLRDAVVATFLSNPRFTRRLLQSFVADPAVCNDARVEIYQRPLAVQGTTRALGQWLPALVLPDPNARSEDPAAYPSLRMPMVAIWGDLDTITPLDQGQRLVGLKEGAELRVLTGVGHIPQIEAPERFNELLVQELERLAAAAQATGPQDVAATSSQP